ncbi:MAG TPA: decaprenyl-phosphate phosphoribosyltransferase [Paludibacteraceae bacterium]|nr:decaprenyl-phosphate phosphoribosyltransferase [Paludibacteraceae bacterium]HPK21142.1 decaprenyl-phosphate phosphoribosyltransferase [Paludibacteraceae bacterium]
MPFKSLIQLLRPEQWAKNLFIFLPLFFSGQLLNVNLLLQCFVAFFAFSFMASSIYCFNDIYDVEADRQHPKKCKRPIASGKISVITAYAVMTVCFALSLSILFLFGGAEKFSLMGLIVFYFVLNVAYCVKLKRYAIVDVIVISIGFVLRILVGGTATGIWLSEWIIIMTFLLALFLAFAKRRDDVVLYQNTGVSPRKNTNRYNLDFMNQVMTVVSTVTVIAYIMYTLSPDVIERFHSRNIYITAIFVLVGIIRYLQITIVDLKSGSPTTILLKDRFIQFCIAGWIVSFLIIIYL